MSTHFARRLLTLTQEIERLLVRLCRIVSPDAALVDDIAVVAVGAELVERHAEIDGAATRLVAMVIGDKGRTVRSFGNLPYFLG